MQGIFQMKAKAWAKYYKKYFNKNNLEKKKPIFQPDKTGQ